MMEMTEQEFKAKYIIQFLASYMATRYDADSANGYSDKSYDNQPIEDAAFLAQCAWEQLVEKIADGKVPDNLFEILEDE